MLSTCLKLGPWALPAVIAGNVLTFLMFGGAYGLAGLFGALEGPADAGIVGGLLGTLVCNLWFLFLASHWEEYGQFYGAPRWPRTPFRRGPGKRRPREF